MVGDALTLENRFDSSHDCIKATHKPGTNDADNNFHIMIAIIS